MTGHQLARIVVADGYLMPYVKLHALMYVANLYNLQDHGYLLTDASFVFAWHGPACVTVTERVYVDTMTRWSCNRPLVRRMRRWLIQESRRRNWAKRRGKINMPGGWGWRDAAAWYAGSMQAAWVLPVEVRMYVEGLK